MVAPTNITLQISSLSFQRYTRYKYIKECIGYGGVKLCALTALYLSTSSLNAHCLPIGALRCHSIIGISHCQDSGTQRYLLAFQPIRITGAIVALVVMPPELADQMIQNVKQALQTGEIQILEYQMPVPWPNGKVRVYEARFVSIGQDEVLGIVRNTTDITPHPNDELFDSIKTGEIAYFTKNITAEELIRIIRQVYGGKRPKNGSRTASPKIADYVLNQFKTLAEMGKPLETIAVPLTTRETQLLNYIAAGNSNKQIARILQISEQTVKNHISSILRKLNANDRAHAVVMAIRNGWILAEQEPSDSR